MNIPRIDDIDIAGKKVLVRADLDIGGKGYDLYRLEALVPTLEYLKDKDCEITLIGHKGRPHGEKIKKYSLEPVSKKLESLLHSKWGDDQMKGLKMKMMENLRFAEGEKINDEHYARHLAESGDCYINEAFAVSHREHASIVGLPKLLPHAAGFRFLDEVDNLSKVFIADTPVIVIIGGVKEDKIGYIEGFKDFADKVLIAGRLPDYLPDDINDPKLLAAKLVPDKEDITIHSVEKFTQEIAKAKTIVVAGPMGKYEEGGHRMGTQKVFEAVSESSAFKIACGGDTASALFKLDLANAFDWVSVGGGASLEFLTKRTLPGIDALLN